MTSTAYATDELRLLARLSGTALPPSLDSGWIDGDELVAEVVATRALLARGVLSLRDRDLRVTAAAGKLLEPLQHATSVVEIECRTASAGTWREIAAWAPSGGLRLVEREPDVWHLSTSDSGFSELLDDLPSGERSHDIRFTISIQTFEGVRRQGGVTAAGELPDGADAWLSALDKRRSEVAIRAAHLVGDDRYRLEELRWLDAAEAGLWLITIDHDANEVEVATIDADELRLAVAEPATKAYKTASGARRSDCGRSGHCTPTRVRGANVTTWPT